jgi:hypothetical protein
VSTRKTTTKKSKASRVQPKKLAATACHASDREGGNVDAAVEFESLSLFPSGTGTCLAEEVYTADRVSHQGTRRRRGAHCPEVRKDSIFQPLEMSTIRRQSNNNQGVAVLGFNKVLVLS